MLRLSGGQVESLFDRGLPVEVRELPADLAALDGLLADPALLAPIEAAWEAAARERGRPTIAMALFVRLMVIKQRTGWGYETLVREVSDSLHLRRFCRIALTERVPDESTVRKLVRRLGPEVDRGDHARGDRQGASGERRFVARAVRIDSTVVEADIRYPTDAGLALRRARALAREAASSRPARRRRRSRVRIARGDRPPAAAISTAPLARRDRPGASATALRAHRRGRRAGRSARSARRAAGRPGCVGARAGRGAQAKLRPPRRLERAGRARREGRAPDHASGSPASKITDRLVSIATPTRGRSARASSASRPSSATSSSSPR